MKTYQAYHDFTAQHANVRALHSLYVNLEQSGARKKFELTPIVVFIAFATESYSNSLGARHSLIWDELERLPWRTKIAILHKLVGREAEWGKEPLQFASEIFALRDKLAHGKPERILGPVVRDEQAAHKFCENLELGPDWYRRINKKWVLDARERHSLLMIYLGNIFGLHSSDYLLVGTAGVITDDEAET